MMEATRHGANIALIDAIINDNLAEVKNILLLGAQTTFLHEGWMPIHYAACKGNGEIIDALISAGADKNSKTQKGKLMPVNLAVFLGNKIAIDRLSNLDDRISYSTSMISVIDSAIVNLDRVDPKKIFALEATKAMKLANMIG